MQIQNLPLASLGQLHPLAQDYLQNPSSISEYFSFAPTMEGMAEAIKSRKNFHVNRQLLIERLESQYLKMNPDFYSDPENIATAKNMEVLIQENTFTITTGHQLNIFSGPLYFIYKIISAISYANALKKQFPEYNFVPVYWMASEDHDFEEINHIHLFGKTMKWDAAAGGPVGRMNPSSLQTLLDQLQELISRQPEGQYLLELFTKAYTTHPTLALATRYFVHELFKKDGLVIIDADDAELKKQLIPIPKEDIFSQKFYPKITETKTKLEAKYSSLPVNPRNINVFYIGENFRTRIIQTESGYRADNLKEWSELELLTELNAHPENFSPNVVLRPMYQETILPNLAYIGGNNEIAYWLELKSAFDSQNVFFPQLLVRDSALFIGTKFAKDMDAFKLNASDLFQPMAELKKSFYKLNELRNPAEDSIEGLMEQYEIFKADAQKLSSDIAAQIVKQSNEHQKALKNLSKEIQRKKEEENEKSLTKLDKLYLNVFPENDFQERYDNFIPYYLQYGENFFTLLKENFNPLDGSLKVFVDR